MAPDRTSAAFHFVLDLSGDEYAFQEVSGLLSDSSGPESAGDGPHIHHLPGARPSENVVLKRGVASRNATLAQCCRATFEGALERPIQPRDLSISLVDASGTAVAIWEVQGAYPVKWSISALDAMTGELAMESIELSYREMSRKI